MVVGACSDESIPDVNWLYQEHGERHGARHYSDDCKVKYTTEGVKYSQADGRGRA